MGSGLACETRKNIQLSPDNTVATRTNEDGNGYGIVCSSERVPVGNMLEVTLLRKEECLAGAFGIYFSTANPSTSTLTKGKVAHQNMSMKANLIGRCQHVTIHPLRRLFSVIYKFHTDISSLRVNESLGIMLTRTGHLLCFVNGEVTELVSVAPYPVSTSLWGVVDVYGSCLQIKASVCTSPFIGRPKVYADLIDSQLQRIRQLLQVQRGGKAGLQNQLEALQEHVNKLEMPPKGGTSRNQGNGSAAKDGEGEIKRLDKNIRQRDVHLKQIKTLQSSQDQPTNTTEELVTADIDPLISEQQLERELEKRKSSEQQSEKELEKRKAEQGGYRSRSTKQRRIDREKQSIHLPPIDQQSNGLTSTQFFPGHHRRQTLSRIQETYRTRSYQNNSVQNSRTTSTDIESERAKLKCMLDQRKNKMQMQISYIQRQFQGQKKTFNILCQKL